MAIPFLKTITWPSASARAPNWSPGPNVTLGIVARMRKPFGLSSVRICTLLVGASYKTSIHLAPYEVGLPPLSFSTRAWPCATELTSVKVKYASWLGPNVWGFQ